MFWIWCQKLGIFFSSIIQPQHTLWSSKSSNWNMYSELFLFQFVTRSVGRFWIFIVYSSNYCAHGSYEHHSIEDHFEKWQGYEKGIVLNLFYWFDNICMLIFRDNKDTVQRAQFLYFMAQTKILAQFSMAHE